MPSIMAGLPNQLIMRIIREGYARGNIEYHINRMRNAPSRSCLESGRLGRIHPSIHLFKDFGWDFKIVDRISPMIWNTFRGGGIHHAAARRDAVARTAGRT
jgi:hypothetical protein